MKTETWQKVVLAIILALTGAVLGGLIVWFLLNMQFSSSSNSTVTRVRSVQPNVVILLADDVGYADFQVYGNPVQEWTGVDRMAEEGMKFTSWYTPASLCSPSRAALLTGRYPLRSGFFSQRNVTVLSGTSSGGLPKREVTIAEALKDAGYATGMVGKWHLGMNKFNGTDGSNLPHHHGFDYVGTNLPVSQMWQCDPKQYTLEDMKTCFVYENDKIAEQPINLQTLTSRLVRDSKNFITENKDNPFFFLLSFPQTHVSVFAGPKFAGLSRRGAYGDSVNEMGWAVEEVLNHLVELGIDKDTLVVFLPDHGPVHDGCGQEGSSGSLRGGKATTWEGGVRIPAVAWWPETIEPKTVSHTVVNSMDLYPTALKLAGIENYAMENNIVIDGKQINGILMSESEESPHEALFFYCSELITAVRYKQYKIHYYTIDNLVPDIVEEGRPLCHYVNMLQRLANMRCEDISEKHDPPLIFNVETDPAEHIMLNPNTTENQRLLEIVEDLVKSHQATLVPVKSEIDKPSPSSLAPCCNPPACVCNYNEEPVPAHQPK